MAVACEPVSTQHWEFVQSLLHDLEAEENREALAFSFGRLTLSIRAFRRVEAQRIILGDPTEVDLLFHKACVTDLISFGTLLSIAMREHGATELEKHGLALKDLEAIISDLQNTFDEWHGQVPEERVSDLKQRIFDAAPELNLSNSRD